VSFHGNPTLSIVVLNHNGADYLEPCLRSLHRERLDEGDEVLVVDNASTDGSREIVTRSFSWVKLIASGTNLGCAGGRNLGYRSSKGDIVWFLDNDTEIKVGSVAAIKGEFARASDIAVVGCVETNARRPTESAPWGMSIDRFGFVIPSSYRREELDPFYVSGCAMAVRRAQLDALGPFDDRYFIFWEEIDLCWRYRLAGHRVSVARGAIVYHYGGTNYVGGPIQGGRYATSVGRRYLGERNTLTTLLKNYSLASLTFILPMYLLLFLIELVVLCSLLRFSLGWHYLKALAWNLAQLPETLRLRREVQSHRSIPDRSLPFDSRLGKWLSFRIVGIPDVER
jgi:GT2 family glycosyltransferase